MQTSEQINDLAAALAKAQAAMEGAKKDSENPHFRSRYAGLDAVWAAIRGPLTTNGLSVAQSPRLVNVGEGAWMLELETRLMHASGQWLADTVAMPLNALTAQGVGSAITYARRYSLMSVAGIAPEDDDGNAAVGTTKGAKYDRAPSPGFQTRQKPKTISTAQQKQIHETADAHGWDKQVLRAHLFGMGIKSTADIKADQFDDVLASVEAGPDAPPVTDGEPPL